MASDTYDGRPAGARDGRPTYRRDAVPLGPFAEEPLDLWQLISRAPSGLWLTGDEIRTAAAAWLLGALVDSGVDVNAYDRASVMFLFEDCEAPGMQAIAGWIARARPAAPDVAPDNRRASAARLLAALECAEVELGDYDRDLPGFLVEDCGTPSVRAITGWLTRVCPTDRPDPACRALAVLRPDGQP